MCALMQEIWKQVRNMKYKDLHAQIDSQVHMTMYMYMYVAYMHVLYSIITLSFWY